MTPPSRAELLAFIARHEPLEETLARFPGLTRQFLRAVLREASLLMRAEETGVPEAAAQPTLALVSPRPPHSPDVPQCPNIQNIPVLPNIPNIEAIPNTQVIPKVGAEDARSAPKPRRLRLYSDGAARGNPGPAGAGAVLARTDGKIVARLGKFLGDQTNNHAEYMGLILGLQSALELGADQIEVRADSELMVRQLLGTYRVKNAGLKPLHGRAKELLARFAKVDIAHVRREENRDADEMSNRAIDERM